MLSWTVECHIKIFNFSDSSLVQDIWFCDESFLIDFNGFWECLLEFIWFITQDYARQGLSISQTIYGCGGNFTGQANGLLLSK